MLSVFHVYAKLDFFHTYFKFILHSTAIRIGESGFEACLVKSPAYTLMVPSACKIHLYGNVHQVPIKFIRLGISKRRSHPLSGRSNF